MFFFFLRKKVTFNVTFLTLYRKNTYQLNYDKYQFTI